MAAKVRTRPAWTAAQLQSDSKTLLYEFRLSCGTAEQLSQNPSRCGTLVRDALVESFAIHCRALITFLFGHDSDNKAGNVLSTDVCAADFFPDDAAWANLCPPMSAPMKDAKKQADKEIAHITAERREVNQPGGKESWWGISEIHAELRAAMSVFLRNASDALFASGVKAKLNSLVAPDLPPAMMPTPDGSVPAAHSSMSIHAKTAPPTDARTVTPKGPSLYGRTE